MCLDICCTGWRRISRCWSPWIPNLCRQDKFTFKYYFYSHFPLHVNFPLFSLILNFHYIRCVFSALLQGKKCKAFRHVHFSISTWFPRIFKKPEYFYHAKFYQQRKFNQAFAIYSEKVTRLTKFSSREVHFRQKRNYFHIF